MAGLKFHSSTIDHAFFLFSSTRYGAVGVLTVHTGDTLGCGERDVLRLEQGKFERRLGDYEVQHGGGAAHVAMELAHATDFSSQLTQGTGFTDTRPNCGRRANGLRRGRRFGCVTVHWQSCVG